MTQAKFKSGILVPSQLPTLTLTFAQVQDYFADALDVAWQSYNDNVKIMKDDGTWDPNNPGILSPDKCQWRLMKFDPDFDPDFYADKLSNAPGYILHMYDEDAISSFSGAGTDMVWIGDDWEM